MLYTHNWWHLALYYLALGNTQKVLQLYDTHVWGGADPTSPKDQVGAIATLLRLELRGIEVGNRWQELAPYLQPRLHEHSLPFQDLHYIYALSRAGYSEWVTEMLESVQAYATALKPPSQQIWVNTVLPTAKGIVAHAIGDWSTAIAQLQPALLQLQSIGGSHTQRNLFKQIYQDALLQAEQPLKHYGVAHIASPIHRRLTTEYSRLRFAKRAS
jgi:hypothetical protein